MQNRSRFHILTNSAGKGSRCRASASVDGARPSSKAQGRWSYAGSVRNSTNVGLVVTWSKIVARERELALVVGLGADVRPDLGEFLVHDRSEQLDGDLAAVVEHAFGVSDPLPDLGAGDLAGGGVFHQVEDRHAAGAAQPALEVAEADVDVDAQARLGDRAVGDGEQVGRGDVDVLAEPVELVGPGHPLVEDLHRDRHQPGVGDPGAVMAVAGLAELVVADLAEGQGVGLGVVLDRESGPPCRPWRGRRGGGRS